MSSPGITLREPWREAARPGNSANFIHGCLLETVQALPASIWDGADAAIVVLRGGALLRSALAANVPLVEGVSASRLGNGCVALAGTAHLRSDLRRLLICDVLTDTGATLLACGDWARQVVPNAEISLVCIYATASARERLEREYHLTCVATFGQSDWDAQDPAAIPYDFGDVAFQCGLV